MKRVFHDTINGLYHLFTCIDEDLPAKQKRLHLLIWLAVIAFCLLILTLLLPLLHLCYYIVHREIHGEGEEKDRDQVIGRSSEMRRVEFYRGQAQYHRKK